MRAKWSVGLPLAVAALCAASVLAAEEEAVFKSGLQPGDRIATSFQCRSVTGPDEGKPLCYV